MRTLAIHEVIGVSGGNGTSPGDYAAGVANVVCSAFAKRIGGQAACAVLSTAIGESIDNAIDSQKADFSQVTGGSSAAPGAGGG